MGIASGVGPDRVSGAPDRLPDFKFSGVIVPEPLILTWPRRRKGWAGLSDWDQDTALQRFVSNLLTTYLSQKGLLIVSNDEGKSYKLLM
jgi:hypothetical protein